MRVSSLCSDANRRKLHTITKLTRRITLSLRDAEDKEPTTEFDSAAGAISGTWSVKPCADLRELITPPFLRNSPSSSSSCWTSATSDAGTAMRCSVPPIKAENALTRLGGIAKNKPRRASTSTTSSSTSTARTWRGMANSLFARLTVRIRKEIVKPSSEFLATSPSQAYPSSEKKRQVGRTRSDREHLEMRHHRQREDQPT